MYHVCYHSHSSICNLLDLLKFFFIIEFIILYYHLLLYIILSNFSLQWNSSKKKISIFYKQWCLQLDNISLMLLCNYEFLFLMQISLEMSLALINNNYLMSKFTCVYMIHQKGVKEYKLQLSLLFLLSINPFVCFFLLF